MEPNFYVQILEKAGAFAVSRIIVFVNFMFLLFVILIYLAAPIEDLHVGYSSRIN